MTALLTVTETRLKDPSKVQAKQKFVKFIYSVKATKF